MSEKKSRVRYVLFTQKGCPNCPPAKEFCEARFEGETVDCGTEVGLDLARAYGVSSTPTAIFFDESGNEAGRASGFDGIRLAASLQGKQKEGE